jgi:N-acetylglucosamine-6-phosphate deacetylase
MKAIINSKIITNNQILKNHALIFNNKIIDITEKIPKDIEIIDAKGAYLSAGFIDIHIHGSGGADVMDSSFQSLDTISKTLLKTGVTSFLATTMTMSSREIKNALYNVKKYKDRVRGAKILGVHLEGPFINPSKSGAQKPQYIQKPNFELIKEYIDIIKLITIAPEVERAEGFIEYLKKSYPDIILSLGHSNASYDQAKESFKWGIAHATHLFNGMNPLHHREIGAVGAILEDNSISCEIIADNIHIHPALYNLIYKLKGDKLILITDAMRAGCMKSGEYNLGGQKVIVKDNKAILIDGTLAGSVLKLNEALKNLYNYSNIKLPEIVSMVTSSPAKLLGLNIGELKRGYSADITLFDKEFNILNTYIEGRNHP